jgi:hypothetical protein
MTYDVALVLHWQVSFLQIEYNKYIPVPILMEFTAVTSVSL